MKRFVTMLLTVALLSIGSVAMAQDEAFDLNNATVEQLMGIPDANINEDMAKAMIEQSKQSPFKMAEDLLKVPGLDNKTLEAINPVEQDGGLWYDPENAEMFLAPSKC